MCETVVVSDCLSRIQIQECTPSMPLLFSWIDGPYSQTAALKFSFVTMSGIKFRVAALIRVCLWAMILFVLGFIRPWTTRRCGFLGRHFAMLCTRKKSQDGFAELAAAIRSFPKAILCTAALPRKKKKMKKARGKLSWVSSLVVLCNKYTSSSLVVSNIEARRMVSGFLFCPCVDGKEFLNSADWIARRLFEKGDSEAYKPSASL